jgi:hypothetical protein
MKLEKIKAGMMLHSYGRDRTVMRCNCSWPVRIISVDLERRQVVASWNNNKACIYPERIAVKWRTMSYMDVQKKKAERMVQKELAAQEKKD